MQQNAPSPSPEPLDIGTVTVSFRGKSMSQVAQELEREYLSYVMTEAGGNKAQAARIAGMAKDSFHRKISLYSVRAVFRCT